jgi:hypothetical protein
MQNEVVKMTVKEAADFPLRQKCLVKGFQFLRGFAKRE